MKKNYLHYIETSILVLIWALLLFSPAVVVQKDQSVNWNNIFFGWMLLAPFMLLNLVHHFILVPHLLFKKKKLNYWVSLCGVLAVFFIFEFAVQQNDPRTGDHRPPRPEPHQQMQFAPGAHEPMHPPMDGERMMHLLPPPPPNGILINLSLLGLLVIVLDAGLRFSFRWSVAEREKALIEREKIKNELAFLRNQVSPHFFMNTLNNIHGLIDIDTAHAQEVIVRLSNLMRHLLYDCEQDTIPLDSEIAFIRNYIDLMSIRFTDKVKLDVSLPDAVTGKQIAPLLFTPLIENAFKYGVSYQRESVIRIGLSVDGDRLVFRTANSIHPEPSSANLEKAGIGIANTRKRLSLLYGDRYTLDVTEKDHLFTATLTIPI